MEKRFRDNDNAEWSNNAAAAMCDKTRNIVLPIVVGPTTEDETKTNNRTLTVGDLINRTDKQLMSNVMLEEKIFTTWSSGRTVLLGD
ncbi:hypothetical protein BGZ97_010569, partial [Linnemannia gamsii]